MINNGMVNNIANNPKLDLRCPGCGAPIDVTVERCQYCGRTHICVRNKKHILIAIVSAASAVACVASAILVAKYTKSAVNSSKKAAESVRTARYTIHDVKQAVDNAKHVVDGISQADVLTIGAEAIEQTMVATKGLRSIVKDKMPVLLSRLRKNVAPVAKTVSHDAFALAASRIRNAADTIDTATNKLV